MAAGLHSDELHGGAYSAAPDLLVGGKNGKLRGVEGRGDRKRKGGVA